MRKKKKSWTRTVEDYAGRTSIHGVGYVFDKEAGHLDRVLWLIVTFVFLGLAASLTWNTWTQWRDEQVVTFKFLRHCTMCILGTMFTFQPNKLRHILKVAS